MISIGNRVLKLIRRRGRLLLTAVLAAAAVLISIYGISGIEKTKALNRKIGIESKELEYGTKLLNDYEQENKILEERETRAEERLSRYFVDADEALVLDRLKGMAESRNVKLESLQNQRASGEKTEKYEINTVSINAVGKLCDLKSYVNDISEQLESVSIETAVFDRFGADGEFKLKLSLRVISFNFGLERSFTGKRLRLYSELGSHNSQSGTAAAELKAADRAGIEEVGSDSSEETIDEISHKEGMSSNDSVSSADSDTSEERRSIGSDIQKLKSIDNSSAQQASSAEADKRENSELKAEKGIQICNAEIEFEESNEIRALYTGDEIVLERGDAAVISTGRNIVHRGENPETELIFLFRDIHDSSQVKAYSAGDIFFENLDERALYLNENDNNKYRLDEILIKCREGVISGYLRLSIELRRGISE